jgi:hypothetical protein
MAPSAGCARLVYHAALAERSLAYSLTAGRRDGRRRIVSWCQRARVGRAISSIHIPSAFRRASRISEVLRASRLHVRLAQPVGEAPAEPHRLVLRPAGAREVLY